MGICFVVCLDNPWPDNIIFDDNGYVCWNTPGYLCTRIARWFEYYPDEGTSFRYAKIWPLSGKDADCIFSLLEYMPH